MMKIRSGITQSFISLVILIFSGNCFSQSAECKKSTFNRSEIVSLLDKNDISVVNGHIDYTNKGAYRWRAINVQLKSISNKYSVFTDGSTDFIFENIVPGKYTLIINETRFRKLTVKNIIIEGGNVYDWEIWLCLKK